MTTTLSTAHLVSRREVHDAGSRPRDCTIDGSLLLRLKDRGVPQRATFAEHHGQLRGEFLGLLLACSPHRDVGLARFELATP